MRGTQPAAIVGGDDDAGDLVGVAGLLEKPGGLV